MQHVPNGRAPTRSTYAAFGAIRESVFALQGLPVWPTMRREDWPGHLPVVSVFCLLQQVHPEVVAAHLQEYQQEYERQRTAFSQLLEYFMCKPISLILNYVGDTHRGNDVQMGYRQVLNHVIRHIGGEIMLPRNIVTFWREPANEACVARALQRLFYRHMGSGMLAEVTVFNHTYLPDLVWCVFNWVANAHVRPPAASNDFTGNYREGVRRVARREWANALLENVCYDQNAIFRWYFHSALFTM